MAINTRSILNTTGATVSGCRYLSDNVIAFTFGLPGLSIYNMKVVIGEKGAFIACPQIKSKKDDKKWNDVCAVYLSDADTARIIAAVTEHAVAGDIPVDWKTRHEVK